MILVDANLLIYAKVSSFGQHRCARQWLDDRLNGDARVGMPWESLVAFARITTNPRLFSEPLSADLAWQQVQEWLALPVVWVPQPTERHGAVLGELLAGSHVSANLLSDAHLAAIALQHGLEVCSTDSDFAAFPRVQWCNPLF